MAGEGGASIPGMGHLSKKELTIGGGVLLVVIAVAYYRHTKNKAAASSAAASTTAAIDPATGFSTGSPEDLAALSAQAGNGLSASGGGGSVTGGTQSPAGGITDNATWAQDVENYLVQTGGMDPQTVGNALGKYLAGVAMTADQVSIAEQGIAFYNLPPQAGPNGYPPNYRTAPPTMGGGNPPSGGGSAPSGGQVLAGGPWFLYAKVAGATEVDLTWRQQQNLNNYVVNYGANGNVRENHYRVSGTTAKIGALRPGTSYTFSVGAVYPNGTVSPLSAEVTVSTPQT